MDYLSELEAFDLVEKKKRGFGLPSIIYVKSFLISDAGRSAEIHTTAESRGTHLRTSGDTETRTSGSVGMGTSGCDEISTSEVPESTLLEVPESAALRNKNYNNNIYRNKNKSNQIISDEENGCEEGPAQMMHAYEQIIRDNICLKDLLLTHPSKEKLIRGIYDLILETVMCDADTILVSSNRYLTVLVKSKFLKLKYEHIVYVLECLQKNTSKVKNMKKYLLAVLFNAPATMDGYYQAEVNYYNVAEYEFLFTL